MHKRIDDQIPIMPGICVGITAAGGHGYLAIHPKLRDLIFHDGTCAEMYVGGKLTYRYEKCGSEPRVGGDTHGAMEISRDRVFFGGWGEAPTYRNPDGQQFEAADRRGKFSHIHAVNEDGSIELLWMKRWDENIKPHFWYAEVTDLLYDPRKDVLWAARGDVNWGGDQGLYMLDLDTNKMEMIFFGNTYKMVMLHDHILMNSWHSNALFSYNPQTNQREIINSIPSFDGSTWEIPTTFSGAAFRVGGLAYLVQGPAIIAVNDWRVGSERKILALPFFACYKLEKQWTRPGARAQRSVSLNSSVLLPVNSGEAHADDSLSTPVLLRFDSPVPQILTHVFYMSGMTFDGKHLYLYASCVNHEPILTWRTNRGAIFMLEPNAVLGRPLTGVRIGILDGTYRVTMGLNGWVGGIPIRGFINKRLRIRVPKEGSMHLAHYIIGSANYSEFENVNLKSGWNIIDLSNYDNLVSFRFDRDVENVYAYMTLEP
ncbi:DUF2139 domain-containing protein [Candidatus Bathyarchaeota archaeon]|nr:DUF2139 domain-containing protein [Candidatus Bathyarchaeota archaeon]